MLKQVQHDSGEGLCNRNEFISETPKQVRGDKTVETCLG